MKLINTQTKGNRKAEIYQTVSGFETFCLIGENLSHAFPVKSYKSLQAATKYATKFLNK